MAAAVAILVAVARDALKVATADLMIGAANKPNIARHAASLSAKNMAARAKVACNSARPVHLFVHCQKII